MAIRSDPVEMTKDYEDAMVLIQPELDEVAVFNDVYLLWATKKRLLAKYGVEWKSPAEMNPEVLFD